MYGVCGVLYPMTKVSEASFAKQKLRQDIIGLLAQENTRYKGPLTVRLLTIYATIAL